MKTLIKASNLSKTFKVKKKLFETSQFHQVLNNISFEVKQGEILSLVGKNGAGKTTLIKIIAGIMSSDTGEVSILDENPFKRSKQYCQRVALVMGQKGQMDIDVSIYDNALYMASLYNLQESMVQTKVIEMAKELAIEEQLHQQIRTLSLGEKMKGELIISLLHDPLIIFLDEPTLGLDYASQKAIRKYIYNYVVKHDAAVILTSHNIKDIEELSHSILILDQGQTLYYGDVNALIKKVEFNKYVSFNCAEDPIIDNAQIEKTEENSYKILINAINEKDVLGYLSAHDIENINFYQDDLNEILEKLYEANGIGDK